MKLFFKSFPYCSWFRLIKSVIEYTFEQRNPLFYSLYLYSCHLYAWCVDEPNMFTVIHVLHFCSYGEPCINVRISVFSSFEILLTINFFIILKSCLEIFLSQNNSLQYSMQLTSFPARDLNYDNYERIVM